MANSIFFRIFVVKQRAEKKIKIQKGGKYNFYSLCKINQNKKLLKLNIMKKLFKSSSLIAVVISMSALLTSFVPNCPPLQDGIVVLYPNPDDCSTFFSCNNGVPILMPCPDGLHFNDKLDVCDWPQNAGCDDGSGGDGGGKKNPDACDCLDIARALNRHKPEGGDRCKAPCGSYCSLTCVYDEKAGSCSSIKCK